jgi:putative iron-dependent peroxidase
MATPQPGIFAQGTRSHRHLEFRLRPDTSPHALLAALQALRQPSTTAGGANIVIGFRPALWRSIAPAHAPVQAADFPAIPGVPATPHDVWVWCHGTGDDVLLDVTRGVAAMLNPVATVANEVAGFVYHDSRDLTGFIDGTENPTVEEAYEVATLPAGVAGEGGAFALTQRWVHDLDSFHAMTTAAQEAVIGRTKPDSVELEGDARQETAHISRVTIEEDGEELAIYRRSVPYGTVNEHGLHFIAFSAEPERFTKMLRRMFGVDDRVHDRLTDFTRPVTGALWFVPSLEALGDVLG